MRRLTDSVTDADINGFDIEITESAPVKVKQRPFVVRIKFSGVMLKLNREDEGRTLLELQGSELCSTIKIDANNETHIKIELADIAATAPSAKPPFVLLQPLRSLRDSMIEEATLHELTRYCRSVTRYSLNSDA